VVDRRDGGIGRRVHRRLLLWIEHHLEPGLAVGVGLRLPGVVDAPPDHGPPGFLLALLAVAQRPRHLGEPGELVGLLRLRRRIGGTSGPGESEPGHLAGHHARVRPQVAARGAQHVGPEGLLQRLVLAQFLKVRAALDAVVPELPVGLHEGDEAILPQAPPAALERRLAGRPDPPVGHQQVDQAHLLGLARSREILDVLDVVGRAADPQRFVDPCPVAGRGGCLGGNGLALYPHRGSGRPLAQATGLHQPCHLLVAEHALPPQQRVRFATGFARGRGAGLAAIGAGLPSRRLR
jgi:hypothetical protein